MSKNVSEKKFVYFIIGLLVTNIVTNMIIPVFSKFSAFSFEDAFNLSFQSFLYQYVWAFAGIYYQTPLVNFSSSNPWGFLMYVFLTLSIISIPIVLKLSKGMSYYKRIVYVYLIHIEILPILSWLWIFDSGINLPYLH